MTDGIDIVIANNGNGDGLRIFREKLEQLGMRINGVHVCGSKEELDRCLRLRGSTTGAAVIFEEFGGNRVTVDDYASYLSMVGRDAVIVPVVRPDRKGGGFMTGLYENGLLNAVYAGDDGTSRASDIISVIARPRSRKDALSFYGLSGTQAGDSDGEDVPRGCTEYLMRYDGTQRDLTRRLSEVRARVGSAGLVRVMRVLPENMLLQLRGVPEYDITAGTILSGSGRQGSGEQPSPVTGREPKRRGAPFLPLTGKRMPGERKQAAEPQMGRANVRDIAFVATNVGVGCTYDAIMCAHSLARRGARVAIVELDDADRNFRTLCGLVRDSSDIGECRTFTYGGVDYYLGTHLTDFREKHRPGYDYAIYDIGACDERVLSEVVRPMGCVFVASGAAEYKLGDLNGFMRVSLGTGREHAFTYLIPADGEGKLDWLRQVYPGIRIRAVPYCGNPWNPPAAARRLFCDVVAGVTQKPRRKGRALDMDRKLLEQPRGLRTAALMALTAVLLLTVAVLGTLLGRQARMTGEAQENARNLAVSMEAEAVVLRNGIDGLSEEMRELERTVCVLSEDMPAGTEITAGMLTEKTIRSDLAQELFATDADAAGMCLSCNLEAGTPLLRQHLARRISDALPPELEEGRKGARDAETP